MAEVHISDCYRCKKHTLVYVVYSKVLKMPVYVCYECRELIKNAQRIHEI